MAAIFGAVNFTSVHQADASEEQQRDFEFDIQELLLTAGYFRARIANLSPFDKVIGGLAWSITASNVEVDIHLIYDEDANIGQKIKLSEAIEFALKRMRCPYPLQAHQIQGLDYPAVFPVVQWLVKKVLETRGEFGDRTRSYSHFVYSNVQGYRPLDPAEEPAAAAATRRNVEQVEGGYRPQRRLRRARGAAAPAELSKRVRCVMLEYGHRFTGGLVMAAPSAAGGKAKAEAAGPAKGDAGGPVSQAQAARAAMAALNLADKFGGGRAAEGAAGGAGASSGAESAASAEAEAEKAAMEAAAAAMSAVDSADMALSGSMAARIVGIRSSEIVAAAQKFGESLDAGPAARAAFVSRQVAALSKQVAAEEVRLLGAQAACAEAERVAQTCEAAAAAVVSHNDRCVAESAKLDEFMASVDQKLVARLMSLVKDSADLKTREGAFKAECKKKLAEMQAELARSAEGGGESDFSPEELARITEVGATFEAAKTRFDALRAQLAQRSMGVSLLSRKLDDVPTQPELLQYEKRFVELHETVQAKLEETRRYYAQYNTLADMRTFLTKEVSLLNSMRSQFEAAAKDAGMKGAFIKSISEVDKGVFENLRRVDDKLFREQKRLAEVSEACTAAAMHRRQYFAAVKSFQEECRKNDELRARLAAIRRQQQQE